MEKIIKATKREVLEFIRERERKEELTHITDLMSEFDYKYKGAQQRIWRLLKSGDIEPCWKERGFYCLSEAGYRTLDSYEQE